MNCGKLIIAWLAGFVVMFLLSGLWYMVIMQSYYAEQFSEVARAEPVMIWIGLGYLVAALLMAFIYPLGYKGGMPAAEGLKFGILIGLIMAVPIGLIMYGVNTIPLGATMVDTIYQVVEKSVGGLVIGLVFGKGAKVS